MRKFKKKNILIISAVLIVVAFISLATVNAMRLKEQGGLPVKTTSILKQDIESNIFASGTIVSKEEREITSDLSGKVREVLVEEGMKVKKGDLLAKLDSDELEYNLKQSEIKLEVAKDKLNQLRKENMSTLETEYKNTQIRYKDAKKKYEDKKALFEAGAISENELEQAKSDMQTAYNDYTLAKKKYEDADVLGEIRIQEKEVRAMELEIEKIKSDIKKTNIISPIDGTVIEVNISELSIIAANTLMFKIQDTENLEVITNISEYDVGKVKIGQTVNVTSDGAENKEYKGTVAYISPNAVVEKNGQGTETVVKVKVDINSKNTQFKPNFSANVEINTANKKDVLVVPYEAIYADKDGTKCIYIVEDNKAKKCVINTGIEGDMVTEIIGDGLKENDLVILNPTEKIKDGMDVKVNKGIQGKKGN
ncbi:efflux RND transporter periplasmic adaptor subunit [Paramaledivibacter caminithermalis]|jgi:HlyD family secretion protein|uniref:HlyD family secretion protein n=1 Tax=Paramaledivibacter caminithermalis (strain DSM 15212 / CIP 107654 / DViRD3) TaxID=1121301 RepID=A0A1M6L8J9_PARC5|nr:efflux RND transporter periplasmic adaptor subunit [Paramaledivibacter caminithermalis]SHJ67510.1 HlyD family secretion protein [Paramaledivibacter caminithermalis DSM 15212]